jgi:hypothetical protein
MLSKRRATTSGLLAKAEATAAEPPPPLILLTTKQFDKDVKCEEKTWAVITRNISVSVPWVLALGKIAAQALDDPSLIALVRRSAEPTAP